jgi:hypothetical protein
MSSSEIRVTFSGGRVRAIYNDALAPLLTEGDFTVTRASHVEPAPGGWTADMGPVGGPVLGPFALRETALAAETDWLRTNRGL